jgi:large subunit ribosomal protein L5
MGEVRPALEKQFSYKNPMQIPKVSKIVINMGVGKAIQNPKMIEAAAQTLATITGQKPIVTRAKKSISNFKLREGMPIGVSVTLRGEHMWEFLDKLFQVALPRVRDFRGISPASFDGRGNYTLGVKEQLIFPEVEYDQVEFVQGMDITVVTTAPSDEEARALLTYLGAPFRAA